MGNTTCFCKDREGQPIERGDEIAVRLHHPTRPLFDDLDETSKQGASKQHKIESSTSETGGCTDNSFEPSKQNEDVASPSETEVPMDHRFVVTIVGARGIHAQHWLPSSGRLGCFCTVERGDHLLFTTSTNIDDAMQPRWGERFDVSDSGQALTFKVFERGLSGHQNTGQVIIQLDQFASDGFNGELPVVDDTSNSNGHLALQIRQHGTYYPPATPAPETSFAIEKTNSQEGFGIEIDTQDGVNLFITAIKPAGVLDFHNARVKPHEQTDIMDFIVSVNGVSGSSEAMFHELTQHPKVTAVVRRHRELGVILDRLDDTVPLGVEFQTPLVGNCLLITYIGKGLVKEFNDGCVRDSQKVRVGDRIIHIMGETGTAQELKTFWESLLGVFQIGVVRPTPSRAPGVCEGSQFHYW